MCQSEGVGHFFRGREGNNIFLTEFHEINRTKQNLSYKVSLGGELFNHIDPHKGDQDTDHDLGCNLFIQNKNPQ